MSLINFADLPLHEIKRLKANRFPAFRSEVISKSNARLKAKVNNKL